MSEVKEKYKSGSMYKAKKIKQIGKASRTPGRLKGETCKTTPLQRWMAKHGRSYKHKEYGEWCRQMSVRNGGQR